MPKPLVALLLLSALGALVVRRSQSAPCGDRAASLSLPSGFCATIFADTVGAARHVAVAPNGDVFIALNGTDAVTQIGRLRPDRAQPGVVVLRDTNGDGRADRQARLAVPGAATGIAVSGRFLLLATRNAVLRYAIDPSQFGVLGSADTLIAGLPDGGHAAKSLALGEGAALFVSVGSATNACRASRTAIAPDPCPELSIRSGIWRYDATRTGQQHPRDGERWATGVRNGLGLYWHHGLRSLFGTTRGRDGLSTLFPRLYSQEQNADTPSEEFSRLDQGSDLGWPYCYHDRTRSLKVLAPEYGGDGKRVDRCAGVTEPLVGFPGHWGPNALLFYTAAAFPTRYRDGVFIAFHGSWNRQPLPEAGYNIVFQPMRAGRPSGPFEVFADGFAEGDLEPIRAPHRPSGLAQTPDGALLVTDDQRGRVYLIVYRGASQ